MPLRAEVEAGADRTRQAVLLYEIGHIVERDASNDAQAVREYLGAYNQDPQFRPPLFALLRLFERRRSFKNLARLYEAELKSATTGQERASALVDRAALVSDHLGQPEAEQALLEQACDEDGESTVAPLMLEHRARITGDLEAIRAALQLRAARTKSPLLRGTLLTELAAAREASDDVDGALETLRAAARIAVERPEDRARFLGALETTARRHDRVPELVAALEGQAALRAAGGGEAVDPEQAREAAGLLLEAGRLRLVRLGDATSARATLDKALALVPDDLAILREHMLACEAEGDAAAAAQDAARILDRGVDGRHAAPFHFRLAEAAQLEGDVERALSRLREAARVAPGSAAVRATLEDASLAYGDLSPVLDGLTTQSADAEARGETEAAIHGYLRAAAWARDVGRDLPRAIELYDRAITAGADRVAALRERQIAVTALGDVAGGTGIQPILDGALALAAEPGVDPDEASVQLRAAYHAALATPYEQGELRKARLHAVLDAALEHPRARDEWGADAARMFAASQVGGSRRGAGDELAGTVALLVRAHRALAEKATGDASAAHLCAAARAAVRAGQEDLAIDLLKTAVAQAPSQRYAITLLEEIYGRRGDADAVVQILRDASSAEGGGRAMVGQLLMAGAAAEAAGDRALAQRTYEEAHQKDPDAERPIVALRRLAERGATGLDATQRKIAIERAAARETRALEAGGDGPVPTQNGNLELGELALVGALELPPGAAVDALRRAMRSDGTRLHAALALSLGGDAAARLEGIRALVEPTGAAAVVLRDQLVFADLWRADVPGASDDAEDAAEALLTREPTDRDALLHRVVTAPPGDARRATALFALADATTDGPAAAELVLAGMRATTADVLSGRDAEDTTLRAIEIADRAPESLEAALAYVEAFGDVDDATERAEALARLLPLLASSGLSPAEVSSLRSEHARALVDAVRGDEALETLATLAEDEDDLSAYEALRVAAREAGAHRLVVRACDRLAEALEGELRAQLLEEAAAILMDYLEVDDEAEPRLRAALAVDPTRPIAYARLHDVLSARGDDAGMLALLLARIDVTDDPDALAPLFYEEARLRRALGQRDEALGALENLFLLESEHVGGLALLVEIHVQREGWQDAVDALRRLAEAADVPAAQRRIARLGAADFLEKRLGKADEAILELRAIEALGLADRGLFERMAAISERAGDVDAAVASLQKGAQAATDRGERAALHRRRAQLEERRGDTVAAAAALRDALASAPLDVVAAEALGRLVPQDRAAVGGKLEEAARTALAPDPLDPALLRTLRSAAILRGDRALERHVLVALVAARVADPDEQRAGMPAAPTMREGARLTDGTLSALRLDGDVQAALELADLANEALIELDRAEPSTFGVGRAELVRGLSPTGAGAPPNVAQLVQVAVALGAAPSELYVGGRDPAATAGIAYRGKPLWIFGASAQDSPIRARFVTAQLALGLRLNVSPLAQRLVRDGLDAAIDALLATSAAAGAPLALGQSRPGVETLVPKLQKVISRRARRVAPELAVKLGDGRAVMGYARGLRATLLRVATVVCGDPSPALDVLHVGTGVGGSGSTAVASGRTERATRENAEARELLRFWLSPAAQAVRTELGQVDPGQSDGVDARRTP